MKKIIISDKAAYVIDWAIVLMVFLSGLLHPNPKIYYDSMVRIFAVIIIPLLFASAGIHWLSEKHGARIQGARKTAAPVLSEALGTTRAMFIVACMSAWPVGLYRIGVPTGFAFTMHEMGLTWWMVILEMYAGIIAVDALTYWKHRLLHTRMFFAFHKHHHSFRDPTPFSGFAVGPLETILTFFPLLFICIPQAKHFVPLYITAIVGFVFLNLYLHCGVTFTWLEKNLPRMGLNHSGWHNFHHSEANVNFGEVSSIWDKLCKTSREEIQKKRKANVHASAAVL